MKDIRDNESSRVHMSNCSVFKNCSEFKNCSSFKIVL